MTLAPIEPQATTTPPVEDLGDPSLYFNRELSLLEFHRRVLAQARDLKGLKALREEGSFRRSILVCTEPRPRRIDGVDILPWQSCREMLWKDKLTTV